MEQNLYIVKFKDKSEEFLKVGKSKDIDKRIKELSINHKVTKIKTYKQSHIDWSKVEGDIHRNFKTKYKPKIKFVGLNECYHLDMLPDILGFITNVLESTPKPVKDVAIVPDTFTLVPLFGNNYYLVKEVGKVGYTLVKYSKNGNHTYLKTSYCGTVTLRDDKTPYCILLTDLVDFVFNNKPLPPWEPFDHYSGIIDPLDYASDDHKFIAALPVGIMEGVKYHVQLIKGDNQVFYRHYQSVDNDTLKERYAYFSNLNTKFIKWTPKQTHLTKKVVNIDE